MDGLPGRRMAVDLALVSFALTAGALAFFSPCAVALLPAYAAFFAGTDDGARSTARSTLAGLRFGSAAAAGAAGLFVLGAGGVYVLRTQLGLVGGAQLQGAFSGVGAAVGVGLIALGALMLADRGPRVSLPLRAPERRTVSAMAVFGAAFALASMGCTLPLFLGVLGAALQQPALGSALVLGGYGVGLAGLLLVASVALAVAEAWARERVRAVQRYVRPVSGAVLVLAGLYVVNYYLEVVPVPSL